MAKKPRSGHVSSPGSSLACGRDFTHRRASALCAAWNPRMSHLDMLQGLRETCWKTLLVPWPGCNVTSLAERSAIYIQEQARTDYRSPCEQSGIESGKLLNPSTPSWVASKGLFGSCRQSLSDQGLASPELLIGLAQRLHGQRETTCVPTMMYSSNSTLRRRLGRRGLKSGISTEADN